MLPDNTIRGTKLINNCINNSKIDTSLKILFFCVSFQLLFSFVKDLRRGFSLKVEIS